MTLRLPQATTEAEALRILRPDLRKVHDQHFASMPPPVGAAVFAPANATRGKRRRSKKQSAVDQFYDQCLLAGLKPAREHKFALTVGRKWRFDFAWAPEKVAVEVEGLVLRMQTAKRKDGSEYQVAEAGGRHATIAGFDKDSRKYATAALLGWVVLRFSQNLVESGEALKFAQQVLQARKP